MRKTNLFYLEGNDSKFLTFSNYGEYLTGICLSTNHKIYPSSFLCLNLLFDEDEKSIRKFKEFLTCYYENKLAWLRDEMDNNDKKQEDLNNNGNLLNYLLEAICIFFGNNEIDIEYFGDIVEHDYNGSYSDSICIVDFNRIKPFNIEFTEEYNIPNNEPLENSHLHNWDEFEDNQIISSLIPVYDNKNDESYNVENFINFIYDSNNDIRLMTEIKFNCVIPLFDVINVSIEENTNNIDETNEDIHKYLKIPYGIWLTDNPIVLHKDNDNISQSWSLVVSSKFSPYPMGVKIEDTIIKDIEKYTYAELLAKNSELLNLYNNLLVKYDKLYSDIYGINGIKTKLSNIEQLYPSNIHEIYDNINNLIMDSENRVDNIIKEFKTKFDSFENYFKWKSINTNNE